MDEREWLAERFEDNRAHLRGVAYRMLGSAAEADDAVQEAWIRLSRSTPGAIENLGGWLTTVVARVCLDMLRSRSTRREEPLDDAFTLEPPHGPTDAAEDDPADEVVLADSVGLALLVVLDTLGPAERVAFVLHDLFAVPFEEIAPIVGRSAEATRQLASRARRRVRGGRPEGSGEVDPARRRANVEAFLDAARGGDVAGLVALLDPDVVVRADAAAVRSGAEAEVVGVEAVAASFAGRARAARLALIDGDPGLVWSQGGRPRVVFAFSIEDDRVVGIELIADPDRIDRMALEPVEG
jgi:RNA polymerase sigma-70 factor (ECF subfamily)